MYISDDEDLVQLEDTERHVDLFSPEQYKMIVRSENNILSDEERLKDTFKKLEVIYNKISTARDSLLNLANKFRVVKRGDELDRQYEVCFNSCEETEGDEISELILSNFVKDYNLDLDILVGEVKTLKNEVESRLVRDKPNYCEVDLLSTEKKEPVEC